MRLYLRSKNYSERLTNIINNIRDMHSSAAPAKIEEVCTAIAYIGTVLDELQTQINEDREEYDRDQARQGQGSTAFTSSETADRNS